MVTLNALALLERKGKTKYWLYQQLGMSSVSYTHLTLPTTSRV